MPCILKLECVKLWIFNEITYIHDFIKNLYEKNNIFKILLFGKLTYEENDFLSVIIFYTNVSK